MESIRLKLLSVNLSASSKWSIPKRVEFVLATPTDSNPYLISHDHISIESISIIIPGETPLPVCGTPQIHHYPQPSDTGSGLVTLYQSVPDS